MQAEKHTMPEGSLISYMSNKVKRYGGINFAQGIPGFQPPKALMEQLCEVAGQQVHQYAPGTGNLELRELILSHYRNTGFTDDHLLVLQGATEALSLTFQYLKNHIEGDFAAMAFDPVYESYKHLPRIMQVPFFAYDHEPLNIQHLQEFIKQHRIRVIFINSPGNPFGTVFSETQMREMRQMCEKLDVFMIIDAVYRDLYFEEPPYYPVENISPCVFYINSFSKMLSITGWRIGYLIAHESHKAGLRDIHDYIGLSVNAPLQQALANYLKAENYGSAYVKWVRNQLQDAYQKMTTRLNQLGFSVPEANGGYYIWTELPDSYDGFEFTMNLYEQSGVAVIPGIHFSENGRNYIRINIARPADEIEEGMKRIENFFDKKRY